MSNELTVGRINFGPLARSFVGFDDLFRELDRSFASSGTIAQKYPPYNIVKRSDSEYSISLAVAGFSPDQLSITVDNHTLRVEGNIEKTEDADSINYVHKGIATRSFRQEFTLGEHMEVEGAISENGILEIRLIKNIPEEKKPKTIAIEYKS
jgi:molecular chaperone IbpA